MEDVRIKSIKTITFNPGDVMICKMHECADFLEIEAAARVLRDGLKKQGYRVDTDLLLFVTRSDISIEKIDEQDARRMYDLLKERFDG